MSARSFTRAFLREIGQTPAAYVEGLRIEHARVLLEDGARSLDGVARAVGFSSPEVLRRVFIVGLASHRLPTGTGLAATGYLTLTASRRDDGGGPGEGIDISRSL